MNRRVIFGIVVVLILAAIGVSLGFHAADWNRGVDTEVVELAGEGDGTVVVVEDRRGFFPGGIFLFLLFGLVLFWAARSTMWRRRFSGPGPGPRGRGPCGGQPGGESEGWHRGPPGSPESPAEDERPGSGSV